MEQQLQPELHLLTPATPTTSGASLRHPNNSLARNTSNKSINNNNPEPTSLDSTPQQAQQGKGPKAKVMATATATPTQPPEAVGGGGAKPSKPESERVQ